MARLLKSAGLNGLVLNNVNACGANTQFLEPSKLRAIAAGVYPILSRWARGEECSADKMKEWADGVVLGRQAGAGPWGCRVGSSVFSGEK